MRIICSFIRIIEGNLNFHPGCSHKIILSSMCHGGVGVSYRFQQLETPGSCFELSEYQFVTIIIINQVKLSCFLCRLVPYPSLLHVRGRGAVGQAVQGGFSCPHLGIES